MCGNGGPKSVIVRPYRPSMIHNVLKVVDRVGGIKTDLKKILKRYNGYLRQWEIPIGYADGITP